MQIRVITHPDSMQDEARRINQLFEAGLACLHLRKPAASGKDFERLLEGVLPAFRSRVILHAHFHLLDKYDVQGIHFTEAHRRALLETELQQWLDDMHGQGKVASTAVHAKTSVRQLQAGFDYVLVSPVFESISKAGYTPAEHWNVQELKKQTGATLVGLGGIDAGKLAAAARLGFEEVAVLGAVWQEPSQAVAKFQSLLESSQ
jgi:thiamine-phosphate pyrophosphorylase